MTHGSVFSGIGGPDLASQWMGWENLFHCEWESFPKKILEYYWPEADSYGDITKTDFTIYRGKLDVLTGGFPCQPFSTAGKRKGATDNRYLWPQMLRAVEESRPSWVVAENVAGITSMVFGKSVVDVETEVYIEGEKIYRTLEAEAVIMRICKDLEGIGYEVQPIIVPACAKNAPHRRDRIWIIANSVHGGDMRQPGEHEGKGRKERVQKRDQVQQPNESNILRPEMERVVANRNSIRGQIRPTNSNRISEKETKRPNVFIKTGGFGNLRPFTNTKMRDEQWHGVCQESILGKTRGQNSIPLGKGTIEVRTDRTGPDQRRIENWQDFPTQSPICGRNDGLPSRLDRTAVLDLLKGRAPREPFIPFAKWRNESIKGYGNAIVPQVIYEIFKGIE